MIVILKILMIGMIQPKITDANNNLILAPFTKEELKLTLFQMHSNKSSSLDGFNPGFFFKVLESL